MGGRICLTECKGTAVWEDGVGVAENMALGLR